MKQFLQRLAATALTGLMLVMPVAVFAEEGAGGQTPPPPPPATSPQPPSPPPVSGGGGSAERPPMPPLGDNSGTPSGSMGDNTKMGPPPGGDPGMQGPEGMGDREAMPIRGDMISKPNMPFGGKPEMMPNQKGSMTRDPMMNGGEMMEQDDSARSEREQKQEERRLEQEKKMKKRQLDQMKRGFGQFNKMLIKMKAQLDKLAAQGAPVPADCKAAVDESLATVKTVLDTEDPEAVESTDMSELQSAGDTLRECGPKIEQAAQLPKIIKQIKSRITQLEKRIKTITTRASKAGFDVTEVLQKITDSLNGLKSTVNGLANDDDPFVTLQDLPEQFQNVMQQLAGVEGIFQLQKELKTASTKLNSYEQKVKKLERAGEGEEARQTLTDLKALVAELKGMKLTADTADELPDKLHELFELKESLEEELGITQGPPSLFNVGSGGSGSGFNVEMPKFDKLLLEQQQLQRHLASIANRIEAIAQRVAGLKILNSEAQQ